MSRYDNDPRVHPHPDDGSWMVFTADAEFNVLRCGDLWESFDAHGRLVPGKPGRADLDDAIRSLIGEPR